MSGALSHIRVLDLSRVLAGPWGTQILADLGAEVIKVERPGVGDDTRGWGPPYLKDKEGQDTRESAYFMGANRGKKSLTLNVATPEGQEIVRKLAEQCDVFIENYKVGDMARYGLSYDDLKKINPKLIYCSVTGFGQTGPKSHLAGYDFIVQGIGGLMSITGERDDLPGGGPQKVGVAVADIFTGMYSTIAILAAIESRNRTGKGQYIDMALLDVQAAVIANMNMNYLISGKVPRRQGNAHANIVPYQVFHTREGDMILAVGNDGQFAKFCALAGCPEFASDERFATNPSRVRNREIIVPLLQEVLMRKTAVEWVSLLEDSGVPCGPINDLQQALNNPQLLARGMRFDLPHPASPSGVVPQVGNPIKMSETPVEYKSAPPMLGQHTQEVLGGLLGLSDDEVADLKAKKVV